MKNKCIFITGGSTGLGFAIAKLYSSLGHIVAVCGRDIKKFEAQNDKSNIKFYQADVSNKESIQNAINDFHAKQGQLDIVIANAGIAYKNKTKLPDFEYSRTMVDINVMGVFNTFEAAVKIMVKQGHGQLAATSSVAGNNGLPGVSFYAASKSFVMKLCESFSLDLEQYGIHTTCIIPGFVDTPLTQVNPHPMPFMMSASAAAKKVMLALDKKQPIVTFPWQWGVITRLLSILPRPVFRFIMGIKIFNFSKETNK
jgi:short-subunit dehydrogenase